MKRVLLVFIIATIAHLGMSQEVDFELIKYKGLNFYSPKSEIIQKLGPPLRIYDPNYECGFLSSEEQNTKFYTLDYGKVKFTGNDKEGYLLEEIECGEDCSLVLSYGKYSLSCKTNITELAEIFGEELTKRFKSSTNASMIIHHGIRDDGIKIEVKEGKLIKVEYWAPC